MMQVPDYYMIDGVKREWLEAFGQSLENHVKHVKTACDQLHVPLVQHDLHDASKWSIQEFPHYARQFHGDRGDPVGFARAWLHHQNHNPHHWEYWVTRSDPTKGGVNGCIEMPEHYVREMIADWMGASMAYTGSWDMGGWLTSNLYRMKMHRATLDLVGQILQDDLGYYVRFDAFANSFLVQSEPFARGQAIQP